MSNDKLGWSYDESIMAKFDLYNENIHQMYDDLDRTFSELDYLKTPEVSQEIILYVDSIKTRLKDLGAKVDHNKNVFKHHEENLNLLEQELSKTDPKSVEYDSQNYTHN